MTKLFAIIRREYLARVRSKWFIITTILAPILVIGAVTLPVILVSSQGDRALEISVVDETGEVTAELLATEAFKDGRLRFRPPPGGDSEAAIETLRQRVLDQELAGYLYIPANVLEGRRIEFWGRDASQTAVRTTLRTAATTAIRRVQARHMGLDAAEAEKLAGGIDLESYRLTPEGVTRDRGQTELTAHLLAVAIYTVVLLYGAMMLRAAVAEKASKTVEIILSSVRPWQLMLGKILGVGAVGLTQVGVWLLIVAGFLVYAASTQSFAEIDVLRGLPLGVDTLLLFLGLFLTGYFLYAGMYASVGAIASTEQEAAQLQLPVTLVAVMPILMIVVVLQDPHSTASVLMSWIPVFTPVLFIARYVLGAAEAWEIPIVFALQVLAILCVAWIGGRIYRVGLLMTGKRPTLPELVRWVRHG